MRSYIAIIVSLVVAFILTMLPLPHWIIWLRPAWVVMTVVYWVMMLPYRVNIGVAWMVGIMLDVLQGSLLGEHALALSVVAYFVIKISHQLRMYPVVQQGLSILIFVFIYQCVLYCIQGFVGELPRSGLYWLTAISSMIIWPWVFVILQDYQRRFKVI